MKTQVTKIELGNFTMTYNAYDEPEYDTWEGSADVGHVAINCGSKQEPLSEEQQAYLKHTKAMANFEDPQNEAAYQQQAAEEDARMDKEEAEMQAYFTARQAATGTESQPIPVPSQSTTDSSNHTPRPGLESVPTGMFMKYNKKGKLSFTSAAKQVSTTGPPPSNRPHQPHPQSFKTTLKRMTTEQMQGAKCTWALIADHALHAFRVTLSSKMRKAQLIVAYNQAADKAKADPNCPCPIPSTNPPQPRPSSLKAATTSTWIIRRKAGHAGIAFDKPFNGNATALFKQIRTDIRQHAGVAKPPITLLGGHWSTSPLSINYVLTFTGKPPPTIMQAYIRAILKHFPDAYHLIPTEGYTCLLIHGAPCIQKNGILAPLSLLQQKLGENPAFHRASMIEGPLWSHGALEDPSQETDTMLIVIHDDSGNKVKQILKSRNFLFGKAVSIRIPRETKLVK
jgi:hypothetical protein